MASMQRHAEIEHAEVRQPKTQDHRRSSTVRVKPPVQASRMNTRRICQIALLVSLALALAATEALFPLPVPVPGIKLGLSNIVVVFTLFAFGPRDAGIVMIIKTILAALLTGQLATLPFGLAGGIAAFIVAVMIRFIFSSSSIRSCSVASALAHNAAQLAVATIFTGTMSVLLLAPYLAVAAIITGFLTGTIAAVLYERSAPLFYEASPEVAPEKRRSSGHDKPRRDRDRKSESDQSKRQIETKGSTVWESM